jgi:hypothetical protein
MRISATIPDEVGRAVKEETDNVSAFVAEALEEKLMRIRQKKAREQLLDLAGSGGFRADFDEELQTERRDGDRI